MIQDRLTAKFQTAKPRKHRETKSQVTRQTVAKVKSPATDSYTKGRRIAASFWL